MSEGTIDNRGNWLTSNSSEFDNQPTGQASISIGELPPIGTARIIQTEEIGPPYTDYQIRSRYEPDRGIYMIPVASRTSLPPAFIQLNSPSLLWIVDWTALRAGSAPKIPNKNPTTPNSVWLLLDEVYEPVMLQQGPNGSTSLYRVSGTYIYGLVGVTPNEILGVVRHSIPPWMTTDVDRRVQRTRKPVI